MFNAKEENDNLELKFVNVIKYLSSSPLKALEVVLFLTSDILLGRFDVVVAR